MEKINLDLLITVHDDLAGLIFTLTNLKKSSDNFNISIFIKCTDIRYLPTFDPSSFPNLYIRLFEQPDEGIYHGMNDALSFYQRCLDMKKSKSRFWGFINTGDIIDLKILKKVIENANYPAVLCAGIQYVNEDGSFGRVLSPTFCDRSWARIFGAKPGHMSFYLNHEIEPKFFDTKYSIAADYKWMLEYILHVEKSGGRIYSSKDVTCLMSLGGASTGSWKKFAMGQKESLQIRRELFGWISAILGLLKPFWGFL